MYRLECLFYGLSYLNLTDFENESHKYLKYLNIINDFFHLYETMYLELLNPLKGIEKNDEKLSILVDKYKLNKDSEVYYYLLFLNKMCSAFRNKISHGSLLSIALTFAFNDIADKDFDEIMNEGQKSGFNNDNISELQIDKFSYLQQNIKNGRKMSFDISLIKSNINVQVKFKEIIRLIENKIKCIK